MTRKPQEILESQKNATTRGQAESAENLSDELLEIELSTVDDKTVRATVTEIMSVGSKVKITAEVPGGETVTERMKKPIPWSTRFKFARIVEDRGYGAGTTHHLVGEEILLERNSDEEWEFIDPKGLGYYWDYHKKAILAGLGVAAVLLASMAAVVSSPPPQPSDAEMIAAIQTMVELVPVLVIFAITLLFLISVMRGGDDL